MSRESGQDRSQKTVAELLALHGGQVEGKRRHRRAADEPEEAPPAGGEQEPPRRGHGVSDTGPQAIIDRVRGGDAQAPPPSGRRRKPDNEAPPAPPQPPPPARPNGNQQPSGAFPRPNGAVPPEPQRPNGAVPPEPGAFGRPNGAPQQESGAFQRPPQDSGPFQRPKGPDSGGFPRPPAPESGTGYQRPPEPGGFPRNGAPPQESGAFQRPPESGTFPRPANGNGPVNGAPESGAFQRPKGPDSGGFPRPPAPESGAFPLPPRRQRPPGRPPEPEQPAKAEETRQVPPLRPAPQQNSLSARLDGLDAPAPEDTPDPGPPGGMASGAFPAPPRRPRRPPARQRPEPEPHTEQFEAVADKPPEAAVPPDSPPAGLSRWRRQREHVSSEDTEVGVMPVLPEGHPSAYNPPVLPEGHPSAFTPAPRLDDQAMEATGFHDPFAEDDEEVDEFGDFGEAEPERLGGYDDYESDAEPVDDDEDADDEPRAEASPAKQWLSMAAQLALGVLGGAAVWLGFNWLWGQIPAAALVAALVVIVGLVWIVRKIRRADDIQTMVLAVLVGLVVTVSPAALLLLSR
ncbi:hypothetical protein [Amycolatopsis sp.]|uniref:hypothetical protein n=1 Tax=Amycolatopsis sp. TaxID=37632 RepID=UPI002C0EBBC4|nr:hypothetical protein [Amycolatopsis sp.]HVV11108.1 hypothetical protein [Amycolatopsis sp.]